MWQTELAPQPNAPPLHPATPQEPSNVHPDWDDRAEALSLWTRLKFGIVRAFLDLWRRLFGLNGLYAFGRFFGSCEYLVNYKNRRRLYARLQRIFPDGLDPVARRAIARRYFQRTRCDKMFYTIFDRLDRAQVLSRLHFPRRHELDQALARGRGAYVAMSHHGPHHVAALIMIALGYRIAGVRDKNEGALRRYIQQKLADTCPEFSQHRMFFADAFPREIFRCYRENFVVASALDVDEDRIRDGRLRTCRVTLFGEPRDFLCGPIQMALRCGAPVFRGFVVARPNFHYDFYLDGPLIDPAVDAESPDALQAALQRYADGIASHVRQHPDHITRL